MKLRIEDLEFSYDSIHALKSVTMEVYDSEIVAIVGPNGSGKSTLLKCINKILKPKRGTVFIDGKDIRNLSQVEIAKNIGYVPQSVKHVVPATVFEVILMGRKPHIGWTCSKEDLKKVLEVLKMLKIEDIAMRYFDELSGGQQQKVLIARALAQEARFLLLDEPTANLDIRHQLEVMDVVRKIVREKGITAVIAIHDLNLASKYADRVIMMKDGVVFAVGNPNEVLTPKNIKEVYNVEVRVVKFDNEIYVIPFAVS